MSDTAYHARVTMHEAKWTDKDGSTVTFKLPMTGMENQRNPFEKFTKRRKGRAGTRFMMVCVVQSGGVQSVYEDEVMLTGWNDSQTNGHTVKFWLCSDTLGHPFEGFERHKEEFYISLVELDDDQEPINQDMRDRVESQGKAPSERLSYAAAMMCKNEGFWSYINETQAGPVQVGGENGARIWLCAMLQINSRAALDDPECPTIDRFHEIRRGFLEWQGDSFS